MPAPDERAVRTQRIRKDFAMMNTMHTALRRPFPALPPAWMDETVWKFPEPIRPAFFSDQSPSSPDTAAQLRAHLVQHYAQLHQRLSRRLGCADLATECLHETWLRLARPVDGDVANTSGYVFRMACHLATDRLRAQRPCVSLDDPDGGCPELLDDLPGPQAVAEARSSLAALFRAMEGLSRRQRAVLIALRVEERSRGEVAQWLGVSLRSVDLALRQALAHCGARCPRG